MNSSRHIIVTPKAVNDIYYRTSDKGINVEVQKISLINNNEEKTPLDQKENCRISLKNNNFTNMFENQIKILWLQREGKKRSFQTQRTDF